MSIISTIATMQQKNNSLEAGSNEDANRPFSSIKRQELFNVEIEQSILGTIILNNEYLDRVVDFLLPDHFYAPAHQEIYQQIINSVEKNNLVANSLTLKQFFDSNPIIQSVGGSSYLNILANSASIIIDIKNYGHIIYDFALKRRLAIIGEDIVVNIYNQNSNIDANQHIENAESKLFLLGEQNNGKNDFRNISFSLKRTLQQTELAMKRDSRISGVSTGLIDLDNILGGMQSSDLIILAGRPSMGKTALAINIAINACKILNDNSDQNIDDKQITKKIKSVGFFSLEMSSEQLSSRILSMETSISATKFRNGNLNDMEWEVIAKRSGEISMLPFYIDDTPALSISAIRTRARRMVKKHNLSFLVIDYLQLIRGNSSRSSENRVQEISEITQGLKAIAKEFNIPILALSQLSRAVEQREDKRPQLSDLRESGSIEQDADVVAFIYRESYYHERKKPAENDQKFNEWFNKMNELRHISEVIIAKQRNGPIGNISLFFDSEFTRFNNLDVSHY